MRHSSAPLKSLAFYCNDRSNLLCGDGFRRHAKALVTLSAHWRDWIRPLEDWRPPAGEAGDVFASLLRHLLCRYEVPRFLDAAWHLGLSSPAVTWQDWFKLVGNGRNIRTANGLPLPLTKKRAHYYLQAPDDLSIEAAFRFAQVLDLGGNEALARSLLQTRLGTCYHANEFWETVIRWLIDHPEIEPSQHGPIIDFLHDQRFATRLPMALQRGQARQTPPRPNLSMKGRTPASLLRDVERWHRELARRRGPLAMWNASGFPSFLLDSCGRQFAITELLTSTELEEEGAALNHCVATYVSSCQSGAASIWSLTVKKGAGAIDRLLTLEVRNQQREIVQARGRFNRQPELEELHVLHLWGRRGGPLLGWTLRDALGVDDFVFREPVEGASTREKVSLI